jgi:hypothetical protein
LTAETDLDRFEKGGNKLTEEDRSGDGAIQESKPAEAPAMRVYDLIAVMESTLAKYRAYMAERQEARQVQTGSSEECRNKNEAGPLPHGK